MTKVKVKVELTDQSLLSRIMADSANQGVIERQLQKQVMQPYAERIQRHYQVMLERLLQLIADPDFTTDPGTGGDVRKNLTAASGRRIFIRTNWRPLTLDYRARNPVSERFWHKRGKLQAALLGIGGGQAKTVSSKSRSSKNKVWLARTFRFGTLPAPLDRLILLSFVTGNENASDAGSFSDQDFAGGFAGLRTEVLRKNSRPFIRRIAARMGQEMRRDLRSI